MGRGPWAVGRGPWAVSRGPWAVGREPWTVGRGPWAVDLGVGLPRRYDSIMPRNRAGYGSPGSGQIVTLADFRLDVRQLLVDGGVSAQRATRLSHSFAVDDSFARGESVKQAAKRLARLELASYASSRSMNAAGTRRCRKKNGRFTKCSIRRR